MVSAIIGYIVTSGGNSVHGTRGTDGTHDIRDVRGNLNETLNTVLSEILKETAILICDTRQMELRIWSLSGFHLELYVDFEGARRKSRCTARPSACARLSQMRRNKTSREALPMD